MKKRGRKDEYPMPGTGIDGSEEESGNAVDQSALPDQHPLESYGSLGVRANGNLPIH